jgi:hypothetical protein
MAACYLSVPAVSAQAQSSSLGPSTSKPDVSDQKLNAAAAALEQGAVLQNDYKKRVAEAKAPAEKERLVSEANNQLTTAVTDQGLSVEEPDLGPGPHNADGADNRAAHRRMLMAKHLLDAGGHSGARRVASLLAP